MNFPFIADAERLKKLDLPDGRLPMVLDTDTYNEVDDQFALAYALLSPERLEVEAVYAAPFLNERAETPEIGMEKSHEEILRLLSRIGVSPDGFVYKGSDRFLGSWDTPVESPAARDLIRRAMAHTENQPLYVVSIGAITNIASAILLEPEIIRRIVVVWLGGNPLHWPSAREFNLSQDIPASRLLFDCGVPVIHIPAMGVSSHMLTTLAELNACLKDKNTLCDTLIELFAAYSTDHFAWSKEIWDIAAIAYLINPGWVPSTVVHSPILTDQHTWSTDQNRHLIRSCCFAYRNPIFRDLFTKLASMEQDK